MPARDIIVAIAAGAAATALTLAALSFSVSGVLLSSFAQLPLFLVGLSLGAHAAAIATASSVALASVLVRFEFGIFFGLAVAIPAVILTRQALLSRRDGDGTLRWYPPAGLLLTCLGLTVAIALTAMPTAIWPSAEQVTRAGAVLRNLPPELLPEPLDAATTERMVRLSLAFLPGFLGVGFFVLLAVNAGLAQAILVRLGRNRRPTPRMSQLALPSWFASAAAIAGIGALFPGISGVIGGNLVLICVVGFLFAGLAVVHALLRAAPARVPLLVATYVALLLFAPTIVAVVLLGILESWLQLRRRFAGPAPSL